ncbi:MAG: hypothetical protein ACRC7O_03615, partial [Fimbriiglobus sp.]
VDVHAVVAPVRVDGGPPAFQLPLAVAVKVNRITRHAAAHVEIPDFGIGPDLAPVVGMFAPDAAEYAEQFSARVGVKADLTAEPGTPLRYDARIELRDGKFADDRLPWPIEHLAATVRACDGRVTLEKSTAKFGPATLELTLETRGKAEPPPPAAAAPNSPADFLERAELTVRGLPLSDTLFAKLPPEAARGRAMFSPKGGVDATVRFTRTAAAGWKREVEVRPDKLGIVYEKFRYPVDDLSGRLVHVAAADGSDELRIELTGSAGGRRIDIAGSVAGDGPDPKIRLRIAGTDVPIDDRLFDAMKPRSAVALKKMRMAGRGDFVADIRQDWNVNRCDNTFRVRVTGGTVNYVHFPYRLTDVTGDVVVRVNAFDPARPLHPGGAVTPVPDTDTVELRRFEAKHGTGRVWLSGDNVPVPNTPDRKMILHVQGFECPVDDDLRAAMTAMKIGDGWNAFQPTGQATFGADIEVLDRDANANAPEPPGNITLVTAAAAAGPPFDPVSDLKMVVHFRGPSIRPTFFPYPLDDLGGVVRYDAGKVDLARFAARHGAGKWALDAGEVRFADRGEIWANLGRLTAGPLAPDAELLAALPRGIRDGVTEVNLRGGLDVVMNHMVVHVPPATSGTGTTAACSLDPVVFWNGELRLNGAAFDTGVNWTDVHGVVASAGRYDGDRLGGIHGTAWLSRAAVAKQPVTAAKMTYRVRAQTADPARPGNITPAVLEIPDLAGTLFSGTVGGEARVVFDDQMRYRLWLTTAGVKLDELAAHAGLGTGAELRGQAQGKLLLEKAPDPQTGLAVLTGSGQIDVPSGHMLNLPVLMPLLKLLKLQTPDQTAFEEAHAAFDLRGDRVTVRQLDLIGTAVSLGGSGELDTGGADARFEFYTVWSQVLKRWLTTPNGADLQAALSGNLFKIEVTKQNGRIDYKPVMLPAVTEPMKAVAERLRLRAHTTPPTARATVGR